MLFFHHSSLPISLRRNWNKGQGFKKALISVLHGSLAVSVKICAFLHISELQT